MKQQNTFTRIYDMVRQIPRGFVTTYGQIALLIGNPRMSRVVGYALHVNPEPGVIPCHRVVNRFGGLSSAFALAETTSSASCLKKRALLFWRTAVWT